WAARYRLVRRRCGHAAGAPRMSECDWPPPDSPDWRPLYPDAIKFLWERFASAETGCDWLYAVLVSDDLPSIQEEVVEGRAVRRPLRCWGKIDFKVSFPIYALHDIEIALGLKSLYADKILVSWSKLGRLYELTVAQPEPAAQSESVEPRAPITPPETAAPRGEQPPREEKPVPAVSILDRKPRIDWDDLWKYWTDRRAR